MLILTLRTDKPQAELGLYDDDQRLAYEVWPAHRQLAETLHLKIREILKSQKIALSDLHAIIVFKGPGSFTGLRIGISVANGLANSLGIPVVGSSGNSWIQCANVEIQKNKNDRIVMPEYGASPHITTPKY